MYQIIGDVRTRTSRVIWMLEELGLAYEFVRAGPHSTEVLAHNASGKVPILVSEGQALTDSTAIMQYIADKHGALTFAAGTIERARQDGVTQFVLDEMDAILWTASRHSFLLPEAWRVPEVKESLRWEFRRSLERLEKRLGDGPFLMGPEMTVPDFIATHCLGWAVAAKFPTAEGALAEYLARMQARPAFRKATGQKG